MGISAALPQYMSSVQVLNVARAGRDLLRLYGDISDKAVADETLIDGLGVFCASMAGG